MLRSIATRSAVALLVAALAATGAARPARSAGPDTVKVGRAVANAFVFAVPEIGQSAHIWDSVGIKVEVTSFNGDGKLQDGLTSGAVDIGLGSGPAMGYHSKGVPATAVAAMYGAPYDMALIVGTQGTVKSVKDLKGKKIGVTTAGSLTDWLVHQMSIKAGWGPDGIESLPMGAMQARVAAMQSGQIAGTVQDIGIGLQLEADGKGKVFQTFGNTVQKFYTHVIFARDDMIAKNPDVLARFLKGWFKTVAYMRSHKAETVKAAAPVLGESEEVVGKLYDAAMPGMSANGSWDIASIEAVRKSLVDLGIADTEPPIDSMYTSKFVPVKI
jgi:ABC-type nitrate/sulfonate/bicarbonate transport system substrate-binding protein